MRIELSKLRWMLRVQRDLLSAAWRGRRSPTTHDVMVRLSHELWSHTSANSLPLKSLDELFPGIRCDVQLSVAAFATRHRPFRLYTHHVCILAALVSHLRPKRIFEFGTYQGEMTMNFALNAPSECQIFTLDLPPGQQSVRLPANDSDLPRDRRVAVQLPAQPAGRASITQLCCDSADFDPRPYASSMDFIYIDGAHTHAYVANDTGHALRMLRPGGVIVWDDYGWYGSSWAGVVEFLRHEARQRRIVQIEDTHLAVYRDRNGA